MPRISKKIEVILSADFIDIIVVAYRRKCVEKPASAGDRSTHRLLELSCELVVNTTNLPCP